MHPFSSRIWHLCVGLCLLGLVPPVFAQEPLQPGQQWAAMDFPVPAQDEDRQYLGVENQDTFRLSDLKANIILFEVIGVYCPQCYKQLPSFNKLFKRINRGKLKNKVKMFALAAGGTQPEVDQLKGHQKYTFPVLKDPAYTVHKSLGQPLTPFTLLLRTDGKILYTHLGVIENIDELYRTIKKMAP